MDAYTAWMLAMGDDGIGGDYTPPLDQEVQAVTEILEMDMYR